MKHKIKSGEWWIGDCLELMQDIPDDSVDLVVTSPPYDKLRTYNDSLDWDFDVFKKVAENLERVVKKGGVIVWNVNDATVKGSKTGSSFRQALFFKDNCGFNIHDTMIWKKPGFSSVGAYKVRYFSVFEYMFIFTKGPIKTFNPIKDRTNKSAGLKKNSGNIRQPDGSFKPKSNQGAVTGKLGQRFNVWDMNTVLCSKQRWHPAPFPYQLAHDHIISWSNAGETVLDPFGGSGTTAVAAEDTGRKWLCIERDETYSKAAMERIANHTHQGQLQLETKTKDTGA